MSPHLSTAGLAAALTAYALQAALVLGVGLLLPNLFRLRDPRVCLYYWQGLLLAVLALPLLQPEPGRMMFAGNLTAGLLALTAILGILAFPMTGTAWAAAKPVQPVQIAGDIQPPQSLHPLQLAYPAKEKFLKIEGQVIGEVVIDEQGKVVSVEVKKSSGNASLDQAAGYALWHQAFLPATRNGKPVAAFYYVVIDFNIDIEP